MLHSSSNKAIMTKARAMYGKRVTADQYEELTRCRTVSEVASFLKTQTHFSGALAGITEMNIHRGQLENLLHQDVFHSYSKLYRYLNTNSESLFRYVILEQEIAQILRLVLMLKAGNADSYILDLPGYLVSKANINLMEVAKVRSYDELISLMETENSDYAEILKRFRPEDETHKIRYVACEHAFYEYFFNKLFCMIQKTCSGSERKELTELLKMRVELLNITSIYRSKIYFNAPVASVVHRLYPHYYKLSQKKINVMVEAKDQEQLDKLLAQSPYSKTLTNNDDSYIEHYTDRLKYQINRKYLHFSVNVSVVFYAYYTLSQIELNNVINIIEGIRYQISPQEMKNLIIN